MAPSEIDVGVEMIAWCHVVEWQMKAPPVMPADVLA